MDSTEKQLYAVMRLIHRYDYDGAIEIFDLLKQQNTPLYQFVLSCHRSVNFNFFEASRVLEGYLAFYHTGPANIQQHISELPYLISGKAEYIFNELLNNIQIKRDRQDYTDFLGRIFQLRELLLKYAVIEFKEGKKHSLRDPIYQKENFESHFKLRHGLMNGIKEILKAGSHHWQRILQILTGKSMGELMDLRHQTIVAHGIETVTLNEITRIYGSPENLLDDLAHILQLLNLPHQRFKYQSINRELIALLNRNIPIELKFTHIV